MLSHTGRVKRGLVIFETSGGSGYVHICQTILSSWLVADELKLVMKGCLLSRSCLVRCLTASAPGPVLIVRPQLCDKVVLNLSEVLQRL